MNALTTFVEITGWTLLHFLWQGTAIALLLWGFLRLARHAGPVARYAAASVALALMVLSVGGTAFWLTERRTPPPSVAEALPVRETQPSSDRANRPHVPYTPYKPQPGAALPAPAVNYAAAPAPPAPAAPTATATTTAVPTTLLCGVCAWAAGVAFFSLRLLLGWRTAQRWRRAGSAALPEEWRARFAVLCETMRLSRPVQLLSSATLAVPVVVGWLRPVVLVPASLLTGLPAGQLTAILAHELAHVRRHDYLVNLLQCLAETLFFYHPAMWWVSSVMRREREHCCDDIATAVCGGALDYARALTALEEFRALPAAGLSAAASPLLQRIRRLAGLPEERAHGLTWLCGILSIAAAGAVAAFVLVKPAEAQEKPGQPAEESTAEKRVTLTDSEYSPGLIPAEMPGVIWGEPSACGLSVGIAGIGAGNVWKQGDEISVTVWLRNDGSKPVKFSATSQQEEGLRIYTGPHHALFDEAAAFDPAKVRHVLLAPGFRLELKKVRLRIVTYRENLKARSETDRVQGLTPFAIPGGRMEIAVEVKLGAFELQKDDGTILAPAEGEWTGTLESRKIGVTHEAAPVYWAKLPAPGHYLNAYQQMLEADKRAEAGHTAQALEIYKAVESHFEQIAQKAPDWNPEIIKYRRKKIAETISKTAKLLEDK